MDTKQRTTAALTALALLLGTHSSLLARTRTVFLEEFDRYGDFVEALNEGASVGESPASLKALNLRPPEGTVLQARKSPFPIGTPPASDRYRLSFSFKFPGGEAPCAFDLDLFFEEGGKTTGHRIHIDEAGSFLWDGRKGPAPADGAPGFFCRWDLWNRAVLAFDGETAALHLYRNGRFVEEARGKAPKGKLVGYNLTTKRPLSFDSLRIVEGATARDPYEMRDYLSALNPDAGIALPVSHPTSIDLGKGDFSTLRFSLHTSPATARKQDRVRLLLADGSKREIRLQALSSTAKRLVSRYDAQKKAFVRSDETVTITNGTLKLFFSPGGGSETLCLFPRTQWRYNPEEVAELVASSDRFPVSTDYAPRIELRRADGSDGIDLWLDGRFAFHAELPAAITNLTFDLAEGSSPGPVLVEKAKEPSPYLPLRVDDLRRPFGTLEGPVRFDPGAAGDVPLVAVDHPSSALNLALCRENLGSFALECNGYLQRSAFDGMASSMHFAVPRAQYVRAYALCAVDPDAPADFIPRVTARLTHFRPGDGRSQAVLDVPVDLPADPKGPLPGNVKAVGSVGKTPLYLVTFDFDAGSIQDVLAMEEFAGKKIDHLDFEFLGPTYLKDTYYLSRKRSPDYETFSSVQVFGATLERSPVSFVALPCQTNSTYYPDEKAGFRFSAKAGDDRPYTVTCVVKDQAGKVLEKLEKSFRGACEHTFFFTEKKTGHYPVVLSIAGPDGQAIISHDAAFSLIPADTRKAGYESPYYMWNFQGAHGTPRDVAVWGEIAKRAGVRKTRLNDRQAETNAVIRRYKLTKPVLQGVPRLKGGLTEAEREAAYVKHFREMKARFPHVDTAMFFHESGGGPFPVEIYGEETELTDDNRKRDAARASQALAFAKGWKKVDPKMKILLGNSGYSLGLMGQLFRGGYPDGLVDKMGDESVGMTMPPEISTAYPAWMLRRLAELHGYKNAKPDACYEWKSRVNRHFRPMQLAAYAARDVLLCHAWHYELIPLPGYTEMANSYYDTIWGYGMFSRWPLAYPHPVFNSCETLTRVLDGATCTRVLPTGSKTAYALEFKRPGGDYLYALWTARGVTDATLALGKNGAYRRIGLLGDETEGLRETKVVVSDEPVYVVTKEPIEGVAVSMSRRYPHEETPMAEKAPVAVPLEKGAEVVAVTAHDKRIEHRWNNPPDISRFTPGKAVVREVVDAERGPCLELELTSDGNKAPELIYDYVFLKTPASKPVEGEPDTIGLWVKGNSSWGKLFFELTDAEGEVWLSAGTGGYGCLTYDWPQQASLNFDGWHFVQFPITGKSPVKVYSPGENEWQWQRDGNGGNGKLDYPVRVSAIGVSTRQKVLVVDRMEETKPVIRLQGLRLF